MWKACQSSKTRCCQPKQRTFWNTMKPGVLYSKKSISAGFGPFCVAGRDKSLLSWLATAVKRPVVAYGKGFQVSIESVFPIVISGMRIKKFFRRKRIMQLVKIAGRPLIWTAGIALCANVRLAMFARHFHFQNVTPFITWLPNGSSLTTI